MATTMTLDDLLETLLAFELPTSADSWHAAGKPITRRGDHAPDVSITEAGMTMAGTIVYVTPDGWAGVVLAGESRCDEWPASRLVVD